MRGRRRGRWAVTVGSEGPCPYCGADDWEDRRQGVLRAIGRWLVDGGPIRWTERVCRNCGRQGGSSSYLVYGGEGRWWSVPVRLLQVLRERRSMEPVPATYLVAGLVGSVLGLATRRLLGWRWWAVPAAWLGGTWLFFLSSALWGPRGRDRLRTELLSVISPTRGATRRGAEEEQQFRRVPFPLFGLDPSWKGPRVAEGVGRSWRRGRGVEVEEVHLLHGDPDDPDSSHFRVTTRRIGPTEALRARQLAERLWQREAGPPPPELSPEEFARWAHGRHREIEGRPNPEWARRTFPVDGRRVSFSSVGEAEAWVGMARIEELVVELEAHRFSKQTVSLVSSVDVEPYLEGRRMLEERRRREHGH